MDSHLIIFAVAQQWFETTTDSGAANTFSTLKPLALEDGSRAREEDYPNNGLVWWKLLAASKKHAQPGRLLAGYIERALVYSPDDPNKQYYQAVSHEIEPIGPGDAVEICTVADTAVQAARELVNTPGLLELDHPPSDLVMVRWRGELYGMFSTSIAASGDGLYRVTLAPESAAGAVYRMADIPAGAPGHLRLGGVRVALDTHPPFRSQVVREASYELALPQALERIDTASRRRLLLLRDDELIMRVAKRLLTRTDRQRLRELLDTLAVAAAGDEEADEIGLDDVVAAVRRRLESDSAAVPMLADALLSSNVMAEPLADAVQRHTARHIEQNAAAIGAQIEERVAGERHELDRLRAEREDLAAELHARRQAADRELRAQIDSAWEQHRARMEADLERLVVERQRLDEHGRDLSQRLGRIATSFVTEHERLLGDLLVMLPVLQRAATELGVGIVPGAAASGDVGGGGDRGDAGMPAQAALELPAYVGVGAADLRGAPDEADFFERFVEHVHASGYDYARQDLAAYHVAVKCGELTLVSGQPGSGRTALGRLHAESLGGDHHVARWLSVPVQATWLDTQDLVGAVNGHARLFEPAATGIFAFLAGAAAEYAQHDGESGVHVLSLVGLDRAAAEQYLAALLHALDQPPGGRVLRCFDAHAVRADSPLRKWSGLALPPSLRIVGTLAGDDAARPVPLSLRDRAHEVVLASAAAASDYGGRSGAPEQAAARAAGPPVTVRALQRWVRDAPLPAPWAELFDRVRAPLRAHGLDLSPRSVRHVYRYVASAGDVLPAAAAVDVQLAQRVIPRLAALVDMGGGVLDQADAALAPHADVLPASVQALQRLRAESG